MRRATTFASIIYLCLSIHNFSPSGDSIGREQVSTILYGSLEEASQLQDQTNDETHHITWTSAFGCLLTYIKI